jgi:hypothetical protein
MTMKNMTKALLLGSATALLLACSSSNSTPANDAGMDVKKQTDAHSGMDVMTQTDSPPGDAPVDVSTDTGPTFPAPPTLGTMQIDRMGRPGVNTALTDPLNLLASATPPVSEDQAKDNYNAVSDPSKWNQFGAQFVSSLAAFDGLDGTCGNQLGVTMDKDSGASTYGTLAGALTEDSLWLNTGGTTCTPFAATALPAGYLAVEYAALSAGTLTDCGGRGLGYDVMNETYNALIGTFATTPISDGTTAVASKTNGIPTSSGSSPTFPYLGPPL